MTSGVFDTSSAVHSRSPYQLTPDGFHPAFSMNAHHPGHWTRAASGGLDPDPVARVRGACPHLLCSSSCVKRPFRPPSAPSWRTSSSGGESHPSALTEPDVRLSPHPAPMSPPCKALPQTPAPPIAGWPISSVGSSGRFAPPALPGFITTTSPSAPSLPHRYSAPSWVRHFGGLP